MTTLEVLEERLQNYHDEDNRIHVEQTAIMNAILAEQKKTNGNVVSLKLTRAWMKGAIAVLTAIVIPLAFLFIEKTYF